MIIELSQDELELVCDALNNEWCATEQKNHQYAQLEARLREHLNEEFELTDMPFEDEIVDNS